MTMTASGQWARICRTASAGSPEHTETSRMMACGHVPCGRARIESSETLRLAREIPASASAARVLSAAWTSASTNSRSMDSGLNA